MNMVSIRCSEFVKRQTKDSRFAYWEWTWEELEALVLKHFSEQQPGYRDGVVLIPVPPEGFYSSIIRVHAGDELSSTCEARQDGEGPAIVTTVLNQSKTPARKVDIVLYRSDVLDEDHSRSTDADWEIISINASPIEQDVPMHPLTMAHNELHLEGGTKAEYSKEQYLNSIIFWSQYSMTSGSNAAKSI
jgi:hypothetical protein